MRGCGNWRDIELPPLKELNPDGARRLAEEIVENAITEYVNARIKIEKELWKKHPSEDRVFKLEAQKEQAKRFFYSDWFSWLCDIDPSRLIKILDGKVECEFVRKVQHIKNHGKKGQGNNCKT